MEIQNTSDKGKKIICNWRIWPQSKLQLHFFFFLSAAVIALLDITKLHSEVTSKGHLIFKINIGFSHLSILLGYQTQYYMCLSALLPSPFIVCVIGRNKYNCAFCGLVLVVLTADWVEYCCILQLRKSLVYKSFSQIYILKALL